jgi:hypothetical protein
VATELNALVEGQIRVLPPRVQAALRLREIEEFSVAEAAQALGIRETALKSRVLRARRKVARGLRKLLSTPRRSHALYGSSVQPRLNQKFASPRRRRPHFKRSPKTQESGETSCSAII